MFLLAQTKADYSFLAEKQGIHNPDELKAATSEMLKSIGHEPEKERPSAPSIQQKSNERILSVGEFFQEMR